MREDEQDFVLGKGLEQARIDDGVGVLGTCCMGADALALVNEEFRVRARRVEGFDGPLEQQVELRVLVGVTRTLSIRLRAYSAGSVEGSDQLVKALDGLDGGGQTAVFRVFVGGALQAGVVVQGALRHETSFGRNG